MVCEELVVTVGAAMFAALPDDTLLLPGHHYSEAPNATMGETKRQNPYLRIDDLGTWKQVMG